MSDVWIDLLSNEGPMGRSIRDVGRLLTTQSGFDPRSPLSMQMPLGCEMDTYHRWMEVAIYATLGGLPALVVPAGFHANGRWPMGIQLIGPYGGDAKVLRAGAAYEQIRAEFIARRPAEMAPA